MRSLEKRLAILETETQRIECTCREPVVLLHCSGTEDEWLASLTADKRAALDRSCPVHPELPQCWIVRISSGEPLQLKLS